MYEKNWKNLQIADEIIKLQSDSWKNMNKLIVK